LKAYATDVRQGLSAARVAALRERHGYNQLAEVPPEPWWKRFLGQFTDLVIWILIAAAVVAGALGEWVDTLAILAIVLLNGILGFLQEERAEQALAALQRLAAPMAKVIRDGVLQTLAARELVPGDRIELEAGDNIPADARLVEAFGLRVQEAALTGESVPVDKDAKVVFDPTTPIGDRRNMVYKGTQVAGGSAKAVVVATGMDTELGRIAGLLQRQEREPTPLQRRLAELGKILIVLCLAIVGVIFGLQLLRGGDLVETLLLAVSLAVAAVPEGLPAVVTIALALGLQRMVKRNALIRKLPSVETLGSVTVICSDKTGTLTRNEMMVREILAGDTRYQVSGTGYEPRGEFFKYKPEQKKQSGASSTLIDAPIDPRRAPDLMQALTVAVRCNSAQIRPREGSDAWEVLGDPTEAALLIAGRKAEINPEDHALPKLHEIPFDSERKAMSVVLQGSHGYPVMYTKGAPEVILPRCVAERRGGQVQTLLDERREELLRTNSQMAGKALRVLALSYREYPDGDPTDYQENNLIFAGLVGMIDPPREEVRDAVHKCRDAGIRPVMITGDHPDTALAIARELQMAGDGDRALTGQELDRTSDEDLGSRVEQTAVYARVSAEHKLRVVRAWKGRGQVVAMTGDGVNDAPAVKAADIGIAMGVTGTDVTKEASDMVLTDDNFASIVNAVEEGRGIFDNIQKFIHFLLSCNTGEVLLMFFAALAGWPAPLAAIQILWINLVTDSLPALALAMEPPEHDVMRRPPRPPREPVIIPRRGLLMLGHGALMAVVAIFGFWLVSPADPADEAALTRARTVAFCIMAYAQLFFSFGCRSQRDTMPELGLFTNPALLGAIALSGLLQLAVVTLPFTQEVFQVTPEIGWRLWGLILLLALTPVTVIELVKLLRARLWGKR
jgi:Ca2+-transporting ATPase